MTGYLKRTTMRDDAEEVVLLRALRNMNVPKFIADDASLFYALLNDLFPGIQCPQIRHEALTRAVEEVLNKQQYSSIPAQTEKITQLHETMMTRHSVMLVGGTS